MEFWPEFLASSWGREFIAGGFGGMAGVISGYPLDTLRIRLQQPSNNISAFKLLSNIVKSEGLSSLYRGMGTPLASVTFQVIPLLLITSISITTAHHSLLSDSFCFYDH